MVMKLWRDKVVSEYNESEQSFVASNYSSRVLYIIKIMHLSFFEGTVWTEI